MKKLTEDQLKKKMDYHKKRADYYDKKIENLGKPNLIGFKRYD